MSPSPSHKTSFWFGPRANLRWAIFAILLLALLAASLVYPRYWDQAAWWLNNKLGLGLPKFATLPWRLGLDLVGGTHLIYEADTSQVSEKDKASAVEGVRDVIERRVNFLGVSEPLVQTQRAAET